VKIKGTLDRKRDRLHREVLRTQGHVSTRSEYDRAGRLRARQRRLTSQSPILPAPAQKRFEFDPADNLIGRLDQQPRGDHRQLLHYDATGRIIASQDNVQGQNETFAYDAAANLLDGSDVLQQIRYYHNDLNGLPQQLTEPDGHTVWQARYRVWGNTVEEIREPYYIEEQNLRFQGQYLDRETGLHYNTFRFYDPDIGRFTTPDPIGLAGGINLYQYAPNPIGWVDPWGWIKCGTGEYKDVGGHHVHAKAGFKNNLKYDPKKGFSLSQKYMDDLGLDHQAMTSHQRQAFKNLHVSGKPNTLAAHTKIAVDALQAGGATPSQARKLTAQSLWNLRQQGAIKPTNIPWYQ